MDLYSRIAVAVAMSTRIAERTTLGSAPAAGLSAESRDQHPEHARLGYSRHAASELCGSGFVIA